MAGATSAAAAPTLPTLLVSGAADRSLRVWNVGSMQRERAIYKRPAEVTAIAASR